MRIFQTTGRKKYAAAALAGIFGLFVVAGQISSCLSGTSEGEKLVILSPHWEGIVKEFTWGFEEWMRQTAARKVRVEHLDVGGGTGTILRYIESEFRANPDGISVDILFGGGASSHEMMSEKGFLQPARLPLHVTAGLARTICGQPLHDPSGDWYGAAMSSFGIVSNLKMIERLGLPKVTEWRDLTSPRVYGWVASGDPSSSGSVRMVFEVILQAYGFEKGYRTIVQIAGNVAAFDEGGNAAPRNVAMGQSAYGVCIDFYGWEQVAACGAENVGFLMPKDLTIITPDPIAMFKGAPNSELAAKFMQYVLSEPGQKLWYLTVGAEGGPKKYGLNRLPVRRSLYNAKLPTGVTLNPFTWSTGMNFSARLASRRRRILADLARATLLDVHTELRDAWQAVIDAGEVDHPELVEEFSRPPVDGDELLRLAREVWPDPSLRAATMAQWASFARQKFAMVRRKARKVGRR